MTPNPLIRLQNLVKTYSLGGVTQRVLKNISLVVNPGEMVAIVGASGSGKSTLMHIVGLLDQDYTGHYALNNENVAQLTPDKAALLRNQQVGFIFQQGNLLPRFTALQNVVLPLTYRGVCALEAQALARQSLRKVGMEAYAAHKPAQLSGGQQQRVAIARALVTEPKMLLADEPTGALDSHTGAEIMALFFALHAEGRTVLIVTHDERIAASCQRQITLADGAVVEDSAL